MRYKNKNMSAEEHLNAYLGLDGIIVVGHNEMCPSFLLAKFTSIPYFRDSMIKTNQLVLTNPFIS